MNDLNPDPLSLSAPSILVSLTHSPLSPSDILTTVRRPTAGALLLFAGTTRSISIPAASDPTTSSSSPAYEPIVSLSYTSYPALALKTMLSIAEATRFKYSLEAVTVAHRLGEVPIGEESILIAVSGRHRREVFEGGEECLEEVKRRVEIWKRETFVHSGEVNGQEGVGGTMPELGQDEWRSNEVDRKLVEEMRFRDT